MNDQELMHELAKLPTTKERKQLIAEHCGEDVKRQRRLESMAGCSSAAGSFLERAPEECIGTVWHADLDTVETDDPAEFALSFLEPSDNPDSLGLLGPYEVKEVIGHGGMGVVLKAVDSKLNRTVALKVMLPEVAIQRNAVSRFAREAQMAAAVSHHDNIVTIHAVHDEVQPPFIVMEYVDGQSLEEHIAENTLSPEQIVEWGVQAANGLAAAHNAGLVHRDIKPANMLISSDGRLKITDFGLASDPDSVGLSSPGEIIGTPEYMSPEQVQGESIDHRVDLYAFGAVLYAMCTGNAPFQATSVVAMLRKIADSPPTKLSSINSAIPQQLEMIVLKLLAKNPNQRFQTASDVAGALAELLSDLRRPRPVAKPKASGKPILSVVASVMLILAPLCWFYGGMVIRLVTNQGELAIEVDDPQIEVKIVQEGVVVVDNSNKREFVLSAAAGQIQVKEKNGVDLLTKSFSLTRGGKTTVRITLNELADARRPDPQPPTKPPVVEPSPPSVASNPPKASDPETPDPSPPASEMTAEEALGNRQAAEYILSLDGAVRLKGLTTLTMSADQLPAEPFQLSAVFLSEGAIDSAKMQPFRHCRQLQSITLARLRGMDDTAISHLQNCSNLTALDITDAQLTPVGFTHLAKLHNLQSLNLTGIQCGDESILQLKSLTELREFRCFALQLTNGCLQVVNNWSKLQVAAFPFSQVTDQGLTALHAAPDLVQINLSGTKITDAGMKTLRQLKGLSHLFVADTAITPAGAMMIHEALPDCVIYGVEPAPSNDPDRRAAQYVLAHGGFVRINGEQIDRRMIEELPKAPFKVTAIALAGVEGVTAEGIQACQGCTDLKEIYLQRFPINDEFLDPFLPCHGLEVLVLTQTRDVTDAGISKFKDCKKLKFIDLSGNQQITDEGLAVFQDCNLELIGLASMGITGEGLKYFRSSTNLWSVTIRDNKLAASSWKHLQPFNKLVRIYAEYTTINDEALKQLGSKPLLDIILLSGGDISDDGLALLVKQFPNVYRLDLGGTKITDEGLPHLMALKRLETVFLQKTAVTAEGVAALRKQAPDVEILWDEAPQQE